MCLLFCTPWVSFWWFLVFKFHANTNNFDSKEQYYIKRMIIITQMWVTTARVSSCYAYCLCCSQPKQRPDGYHFLNKQMIVWRRLLENIIWSKTVHWLVFKEWIHLITFCQTLEITNRLHSQWSWFVSPFKGHEATNSKLEQIEQELSNMSKNYNACLPYFHAPWQGLFGTDDRKDDSRGHVLHLRV